MIPYGGLRTMKVSIDTLVYAVAIATYLGFILGVQLMSTENHRGRSRSAGGRP